MFHSVGLLSQAPLACGSCALPSVLFVSVVGGTAYLSMGNCLPLGFMPEGTIVCALEEKYGDHGKLVKASGFYATIITQNPDTHKTRVKLPSGSKKVCDPFVFFCCSM